MATDGLDLLVNNAGGIPLGGGDPAHRGGFATIDDDAWQRTLDLNLLSAVRVTRALVDFLLRRRGVIINVSSEQHRRRRTYQQQTFRAPPRSGRRRGKQLTDDAPRPRQRLTAE